MTEKHSPLLPCPFCGKPTEYVCDSDHHGDYFRLGCTDEDCPAHWTYYTEAQENAEKCIARWNTRAVNGLPEAIAALAFYRDAWTSKPNKMYGGLEWSPKEELLEDCGERAKAALTKGKS